MRTIFLISALIVTSCLQTSAGTFALLGKDFAFKSTGAQEGAGAWKLSHDGYIGTLISLSKPARVAFSVEAAGRGALMHVHVGDKRFVQSVTGLRAYKFACDLPAGVHCVRIELNVSPLRNDISFLQVESLGVSGDGVEVRNVRDDKAVLDAADSYIENYRKGSAELVIADGKGKPLPVGTVVQVKLRRHTFNFGTAVYGTNATSGSWLQDSPAPGSDALKFQEFVKSHFNMIVPENAGKWGACEGERDLETMGFVDSILKWAATNGLRARMHCVLWGQSPPKWAEELLEKAKSSDSQVSGAARSELRGQITQRINCVARDRADSYIELDGINESAHQDGFLKAYGRDGLADIYDEMITASAGRARVYFNEFNLFQWSKEFGYKDEYGNWYADHIRSIINSGMDAKHRDQIGIGMQYYPSADENALKNCPHSPVRIAQTLQLMSIFESPMSLTEFAAWPAGESDTAQLLSDTMRLVFGNDQTTSFLTWGFWKSHMWAKGSAFVDEKWNLTQTGKTYEQLLGIHDWDIQGVPTWTTDLTLSTDRKGRIAFRGFYGEYDVTINGRTYPLTISRDKAKYSLKSVR